MQRGAWRGARRCTEGCAEVHGGVQRCAEGCTEVCGGVRGGVQRCVEGCMEVHGGAQRCKEVHRGFSKMCWGKNQDFMLIRFLNAGI